MKTRQDGKMPLRGRTPTHAEWRLLERTAEDMIDYLDANDLKLIKDIAQKRDIERYKTLDKYWGLQSIDPRYQIVGTRDACLYQLSSLLKKTQWAENITDLQASNATQLFLTYERNMREYNRNGYRQLTWSDDEQVQIWWQRIQDFCRKVLGPLDMKSVLRYARPGPGSTFGLTAQLGHKYYKYATIPYEVTSNGIEHARRLIKSDERWLRAIHEHPPLEAGTLCYGELPADDILFRVVPGNRIGFVFKKEDIARTMASEPSMNVMLQLGVDGHVRKRLLKFGININDQQINKLLAQQGSIDNLLATLDLVGASENISMRWIEKALPYEWVEYLFDLRSDVGSLPDGSSINYEKLSSMGNGYTFAIETLVFAACVYAVAPEVNFGIDAHVYGDDIIVPTKHVSDLVRLLNLSGFEVNTEKSFFDDTFTRESCGGDFYRGTDFRPIFLKKSFDLLDVFAFYSFHNRLREWFSRVLHVTDPQCCALLRGWCSTKWQLYGPPDTEDQSSYLAVSEPPYGRTRDGIYPYDRAVAQVQVFPSMGTSYNVTNIHETSEGLVLVTETSDPYFQLLTNYLSAFPETQERDITKRKLREAVGSQYDITKRNSYKIRARRRDGRALAWPTHHHDD